MNPSFAWAESELALLEGSPAIAATRSMQLKPAEYDPRDPPTGPFPGRWEELEEPAPWQW